MKYVVNSSEMKRIDEYTVQVLKFSALELMERAAVETVAVMKQRIHRADRILVVCGSGNNGGDGVAAGRILYVQGYHVAILFIGEKDKITPAMKYQLDIARNLGIPEENSTKLHEYNIIIDSIFGVGLARDIKGPQEDLIHAINVHKNAVYAVDMPSGISADNGKIMNVAVKADYTVTYGHQKQGLLLYPGAEYAGEITVADIGFPEKATGFVQPSAVYYEPEDLLRLPLRRSYSHKGSYGRVLIIAGSKGMSGAAYFSAKASYRTGAGLVKILTAQENRIILQTSLPEALFSAYDEEGFNASETRRRVEEELKWASVIVVGPGLGQSDCARELVRTVINKADVPVILDADAINLLAKELDFICGKGCDEKDDIYLKRDDTSEIRARLSALDSMLRNKMILTPHLQELAGLLGIPTNTVANNLFDTACQCSYNSKLIYAIKDARTVVVEADQRYINVSGNHGMATGGSGDVLTGIIAALIAQKMMPYAATCLGVYIHGLAGEQAAKKKSSYSIMASDIIDSIETVLYMAESKQKECR